MMVLVNMVTAFEPIWILTAVGYLAHRQRLLGENATSVLSRFVFPLAMPAALFLTLAKTPLSGFEGKPLAAFSRWLPWRLPQRLQAGKHHCSF